MMEAARPPLRVVGDYEQIAKDLGNGDAVVVDRATGSLVADSADVIAGLLSTVAKQSRTIGQLERKLRDDEEEATGANSREIAALFERWQEATGRTKTKFGKPRMKLVKARLRDGFKIAQEEGDEPEATLELAVDGIAAFPYRVYDRRHPTGRPSDLHNDFDLALKDEKHVEDLARLGWLARTKGWTPSGGWPKEEGK